MRSEPPDEMVWDGWLEPIAVPTRWDLFRVAFYRDPVCPYSVGVGYTERSVGRHLCVYLIGQVTTQTNLKAYKLWIVVE